MYVIDIVKAYLAEHGYDGLSSECEAGYRAPCDCGEHNWHIVAKKPTTDPAVLDRLTAKLIEGMKAEATDAKPTCEKCGGTKRVKCPRYDIFEGIADSCLTDRRKCITICYDDDCTVPCDCAKGEGR